MTLLSIARTVAAALACTAAGLMLTTSTSAHPYRPDVRVYDFSALDAPLRVAAITEARAILAEGGAPAEWNDCPGTKTGCAPEPADLIVRIVREPGTQPVGWRRALGFSVVNPAIGTGRLATVYVNRVETAARRAGVEVGLLLARALAHEVGHLLLRTNGHAEAGLMRATWTDQELTRNVARDWQFGASDRRQLRAAWQRAGRVAAR